MSAHEKETGIRQVIDVQKLATRSAGAPHIHCGGTQPGRVMELPHQRG